MVGHVFPVVDRGNPSDGSAVPVGDERLYFGVLVKRVFILIERRFDVTKKRRDPVRVFVVDPIRKMEKVPESLPIVCRLDLDAAASIVIGANER